MHHIFLILVIGFALPPNENVYMSVVCYDADHDHNVIGVLEYKKTQEPECTENWIKVRSLEGEIFDEVFGNETVLNLVCYKVNLDYMKFFGDGPIKTQFNECIEFLEMSKYINQKMDYLVHINERISESLASELMENEIVYIPKEHECNGMTFVDSLFCTFHFFTNVYDSFYRLLADIFYIS
jgi:CRISPR/Cas system-associated protein Cas10 (large subunit of type III CRISPR-Cas system)